jgi:hypothetical protein
VQQERRAKQKVEAEAQQARAERVQQQLQKQNALEAQEQKAEREQEAIEKREAEQRQKKLDEARKRAKAEKSIKKLEEDDSMVGTHEGKCHGREPCELQSEDVVEAKDGPVAPCHDAVDGEECFGSVNWAMDQGVTMHPEWYPSLSADSPFSAFQEHLHSLGLNNCSRPCSAAGNRASSHTSGVQTMEFYVYRVQNEAERPLTNDVASSLTGILWYLHNEIIPLDREARFSNLSRIVRFKITVKTTRAFFEATGRQFAPFAPFEDGGTADELSVNLWAKYGYVVGCRRLDSRAAAYGSAREGDVPVAFSLPGPCPGLRFAEKSASCSVREPGGACSSATQSRDCTFSATPAGEISLDELMGIRDYRSFYYQGKREYILETDMGVGCVFWNKKHDSRLCAERVDRVRQLFRAKYPELPACESLPEPTCDAQPLEVVGEALGSQSSSSRPWPGTPASFRSSQG